MFVFISPCNCSYSFIYSLVMRSNCFDIGRSSFCAMYRTFSIVSASSLSGYALFLYVPI